jgi:hypothetical protein
VSTISSKPEKSAGLIAAENFFNFTIYAIHI